MICYVNDCLFWYTSEARGKCFVETLVKIFHVKFLGYSHWFISIIISQIKYHLISVYQAGYATSVVYKHLYNITVKTSTKFYNITLSFYMIFTKDDTFTSDEQVEMLTREFKVHYRACIGLLIYLVYTIVDLSFSVQNLAKFSSNSGKVHFEEFVHFLDTLGTIKLWP